MFTKMLSVLLVSLCLVGCTANQRAKSFGGSEVINLPANQKLVTATWKDSELWYLTTPMVSNDIPKTSTLVEKSSFGMIEGEVQFVESR